jgi:hypothetical protein
MENPKELERALKKLWRDQPGESSGIRLLAQAILPAHVNRAYFGKAFSVLVVIRPRTVFFSPRGVIVTHREAPLWSAVLQVRGDALNSV